MKKSKLPVAMPSSGSYKPSKNEVDRERRYRAERAISTLKEADEIKRDKSLLKDVKSYVKEQQKIASKI